MERKINNAGKKAIVSVLAVATMATTIVLPGTGFTSGNSVLDSFTLSASAASVVSSSQQQSLKDIANSRVGQSYPSQACQAFVREVYTSAGVNNASKAWAIEAAQAWVVSKDTSNIPIGACVYTTGWPYTGTPYKAQPGHVGVFVGDGVVSAKGPKVVKESLADFIRQSGSSNIYLGWGGNGGVEFSTANNNLTDVTASFSGKTIQLRSIENGKFLCADSDEQVYANRDSASTWETFDCEFVNGYIALKSQNNSKYLCVRMDIGGYPVKAYASVPSTWERIAVYKRGNDYYLKSIEANKFLTASVDKSNAPLEARGDANTWERFSVNFVNSGGGSSVQQQSVPNVTYRVRTVNRGWLPAVTNYSDYAGVENDPITDIAVGVSSGSVRYRVHNKGGSWLPYVTGNNINDYNNGYAGSGKQIDAVQVEFTQNGQSWNATYRVSPTTSTGYYSEVRGLSDYAGVYGVSMDKLQIKIG
ncbi:hypothetical protein FACS1894133_5850 [Clostridia bacterium]|nr:hypothetical protein FACS1894133_5850 [Clostridia bacterium]